MSQICIKTLFIGRCGPHIAFGFRVGDTGRNCLFY